MNNFFRQLLTVDVSVLARMKNAAKCDTWCESQEPASHRVFERTSRPWYSWGHACPSAAAQPIKKRKKKRGKNDEKRSNLGLVVFSFFYFFGSRLVEARSLSSRPGWIRTLFDSIDEHRSRYWWVVGVGLSVRFRSTLCWLGLVSRVGLFRVRSCLWRVSVVRGSRGKKTELVWWVFFVETVKGSKHIILFGSEWRD